MRGCVRGCGTVRYLEQLQGVMTPSRDLLTSAMVTLCWQLLQFGLFGDVCHGDEADAGLSKLCYALMLVLDGRVDGISLSEVRGRRGRVWL